MCSWYCPLIWRLRQEHHLSAEVKARMGNILKKKKKKEISRKRKGLH
jgi:pantothenate kinase-related protein Tda10